MTTETAVAQDIQKHFEQAGFAVGDVQPGRIEVKKNGCVAYLGKTGGGLDLLRPALFRRQGNQL